MTTNTTLEKFVSFSRNGHMAHLFTVHALIHMATETIKSAKDPEFMKDNVFDRDAWLDTAVEALRVAGPDTMMKVVTTADIIRAFIPEDYKSLTRKQAKSLIRVINRQGRDRLRRITNLPEYYEVWFTHIMIGVEKNPDGTRNVDDGYAHS